MVEINLLPWREKELIYKNKITLRIALCALIASLSGMLILHEYLARQDEQIVTALNQLEQERNIFQEKMQRVKVSESNVVAPGNQFNVNAFMHLLSQVKTKAICFDKIKKQKEELLFSGRVNSLTNLTNFLTNWSDKELLREVYLDGLIKKKDAIHFKFRASRGN